MSHYCFTMGFSARFKYPQLLMKKYGLGLAGQFLWSKFCDWPKHGKRKCVHPSTWWTMMVLDQGGLALAASWDCKQMIIFPPAKPRRRYAGALHCTVLFGQIHFAIQTNTYDKYFSIHMTLQCCLHSVTLCYTLLHCVTLYTVLHCVTLCYTVLHCVTLCTGLIPGLCMRRGFYFGRHSYFGVTPRRQLSIQPANF